MATLAEFAVASLVIELTPGPNMAYLATLAVTRGRRPAMAAVAGVSVGLLVLGALASAGVQTLVLETPALYQAIRWAGALYLLWLAWTTWRPPSDAGEGAGSEFASFRDGFVTNLLNPKAAMFYVTVMPRFAAAAEPSPAARLVLLTAVYVAIATAIHAAIVLFADHLRPTLAAGAGVNRVRRAMAIALVAVAAWLVAKT
jgi:threonine/homoserine/homoserine lactone efflux protein